MNKMSQKTFWTILQKCHKQRPFRVLAHESIRQSRTLACPVVAVAKFCTGEKYHSEGYDYAAADIGLSADFAYDVASSADCSWATYSNKLRRLLGLVSKNRK